MRLHAFLFVAVIGLQQTALAESAAFERLSLELNTRSSVVINATADKAWPHIVDPNTWKQGAKAIHVAGPKGQLGEISKAVTQEDPDTVQFYAQTVEFVPNKIRTIKLFAGNNGPLIGYASWVLEEMNGRTKLSYIVHTEAPLTEDMIAGQTAEEIAAFQADYQKSNADRFQRELEALKAMLEGGE